jgi:hypothetical protein
MILLLLSLLSLDAYGFPEMVRHGYFNCNACHANAGGGGLLNEYGRSMAAELLSTWSVERESNFVYGKLKEDRLAPHLRLGGSVRGVQIHRENHRIREGRFVVMESNLEGSLALGKFQLVGSYGRPTRDRRIEGRFNSYFLQGQVSDFLDVKIGLFTPSFGLRMENHTLPTRQRLGFGMEAERYGLETIYSGELWSLAGYVSESKGGRRTIEGETAAGFRLDRLILEKHRLGLSTFFGSDSLGSRELIGQHGVLAWTKKFYSLYEITWQRSKRSGITQEGVYQFTRTGWEPVRGFHILAQQEWFKTNLKVGGGDSFGAGPGLYWFPRPHFAAELMTQGRKPSNLRGRWELFATLMLHYYL